MREQLLVNVSFDTSLQDIDALREEMQNFVLDKENSRDFQDEILVEVTSLNSMDKLELKVEIMHKVMATVHLGFPHANAQQSNWSNETLRAARRSKFLCALTLALRKVPIYAPGGGNSTLGSADQPTYSVAVNNEQAEAARVAFAAAKDAKRLKPSNPSVQPTTELDVGNNGAASTSVETDSSHLPSSKVRARSGTLASLAETNALASLTARAPAMDSAHDWQDRDGSTPVSTFTPYTSQNPNSVIRADSQRTRDLDQIYKLMRNESTTGKRRPSSGLHNIASGPSQYMPSIREHTGEYSSSTSRDSSRERAEATGNGRSPYSSLAGRDITDNGSAFGPGWNSSNYIPHPQGVYEPFTVPLTPTLGQIPQSQQPAPSAAAQRYEPQQRDVSAAAAVRMQDSQAANAAGMAYMGRITEEGDKARRLSEGSFAAGDDVGRMA